MLIKLPQLLIALANSHCCLKLANHMLVIANSRHQAVQLLRLEYHMLVKSQELVCFHLSTTDKPTLKLA